MLHNIHLGHPSQAQLEKKEFNLTVDKPFGLSHWKSNKVKHANDAEVANDLPVISNNRVSDDRTDHG